MQNLMSSEGKSVYLLELANAGIPLWEESIWKGDENWKKLWSPFSKELKESDAIIIISPEYGGMVPSALKNFFLLCSDHELAHKPGLIVGVSASRGGAYPVSELRMSSFKNTHICYIPEHIIIRNVKEVLNEKISGLEEDAYVRGRIEYALKILYAYGDALKPIRNAGILDYKNYPNGM